MQILLEEWKQIAYKTERINTFVWNFIYLLIYLFIDVLVYLRGLFISTLYSVCLSFLGVFSFMVGRVAQSA